MKTKIFYKLILFIFLLNCGYSPVLTHKEYLFDIGNIEKIGNKKVNSFIGNKLNTFKSKKDSNKKSFNIIIDSKLSKETISKDTKGDPAIFELQINTEVKIINSINNSLIERKINKKLSYNNLTDKFELSRYEDTLIKNLSLNIGDRIISILSNL